MKFQIREQILDRRVEVDPDLENRLVLSRTDLIAEEDFVDFVKKVIIKIGTVFENHKAMVAYINSNMKLFGDLNKDSIVCTVKPKDLSAVANALEEINEALQKLRRGEKLNLAEVCNQTLETVGIKFERGRVSVVDFKNGNWGDGKDKTGLDHPMTYHKKVEEFGWENGATVYAERFCKLASDVVGKSQLIAASNRHYKDVKQAMARGLGKSQAVFEREVAVDQINQINLVRDMLIRFYFGQLKALMKGANIQPVEPKKDGTYVPNTWTGQ